MVKFSGLAVGGWVTDQLCVLKATSPHDPSLERSRYASALNVVLLGHPKARLGGIPDQR